MVRHGEYWPVAWRLWMYWGDLVDLGILWGVWGA